MYGCHFVREMFLDDLVSVSAQPFGLINSWNGG
jgi:hypothetical protein